MKNDTSAFIFCNLISHHNEVFEQVCLNKISYTMKGILKSRYRRSYLYLLETIRS
jgi:hypothetical protein